MRLLFRQPPRREDRSVAASGLPAIKTDVPARTPEAEAADLGEGPLGPAGGRLELSARELFEKASPAVVRIEVRDRRSKLVAQGSGFFVSDDGLIVTNYHVIAGAYHAVARLSNGSEYPVEGVAAVDQEGDLSLLKVNGKDLPFLEATGQGLTEVGTKVYAIGNPQGLTNTLSEGLVSGHRVMDAKVTVIQTTAAISPGSSGGPLLTADGSVVAVTSSYLEEGQNLNFAVPAARVRRLIDNRGVLRRLGEVGKRRMYELTRTDIVQMSEVTSDQVEVFGVHLGMTFEEAKRVLGEHEELTVMISRPLGFDEPLEDNFSVSHREHPLNVLFSLRWERGEEGLNMLCGYETLSRYVVGRTKELWSLEAVSANSGAVASFLGHSDGPVVIKETARWRIERFYYNDKGIEVSVHAHGDQRRLVAVIFVPTDEAAARQRDSQLKARWMLERQVAELWEKWGKLRKGMTRADIQKLLGDPTKVTATRSWYYSYRKAGLRGEVHFKPPLYWRVTGWDQPRW